MTQSKKPFLTHFATYEDYERALKEWVADKKRAEADREVQREKDAIDAARYRWLRDHVCNSLHLSRDGEHACNYMTAKEWIEEEASEDFAEVPSDEVQKMKDTNTIWKLQIYEYTPVGFTEWRGASLDYTIDTAISAEKKEGGMSIKDDAIQDLRAKIEALPRYEMNEMWGLATMDRDAQGEWLNREAVLALFPPAPQIIDHGRSPKIHYVQEAPYKVVMRFKK